jgi:hypothetical protein
VGGREGGREVMSYLARSDAVPEENARVSLGNHDPSP